MYRAPWPKSIWVGDFPKFSPASNLRGLVVIPPQRAPTPFA